MKCNFYRADDPNITPAKRQKFKKCERCEATIPALYNKKYCSACSEDARDLRRAKEHKPKAIPA